MAYAFPYKVSRNTQAAYATSNVMKNSAGEQPRKTRADDFEWEKNLTPPPLRFFAALTLSRIFHRIDPQDSLLWKDRDMLMDLYPDDIPLKFSVPLIKVLHSRLLLSRYNQNILNAFLLNP